ncbi:MAG: SpoIIE family protein phosphatase [Janthinobacterium lividum]
MQAIEVTESSQVAEARRAAVSQAHGQGFGEQDAGRVAIVATELATNLVKYGGGGALVIGSFDDKTGSGIECLALDRGAGMQDVEAAMRDGHSASGSLGMGLGAVRRASAVLDVYSQPGSGTAILARVMPGVRPAGVLPLPMFGAVALPIGGEDVSGDAWCHGDWPGGWTAMMADGLGHGPSAAEAAHAAVRCFSGREHTPPADMLAQMHAALRPTRGAAVALAQVDPRAGEVRFAGVGNIAGALCGPDATVRRMVSHNGTVGHITKHMREFVYPFAGATLLVLASDGLLTNWRLDGYPGLLSHHPSLIAGVLYRDFNRGRDDVSILVCRLDAA